MPGDRGPEQAARGRCDAADRRFQGHCHTVPGGGIARPHRFGGSRLFRPDGQQQRSQQDDGLHGSTFPESAGTVRSRFRRDWRSGKPDSTPPLIVPLAAML